MQPLYATAYGNGMLPLMETVCYHLWKRYVTALGNPSKLPNTICNRLWKRYVTTYGNGMLPL